MKTHITTSCFLGAILSLISFQFAKGQQYDQYDISQYYTPDIIRNSLDLTFNTSGNFINSEASAVNNNNGYLTGYLNSAFNRIIDTRKRISSINIQEGLAGYYSYNNVENASYNKISNNKGSVSLSAAYSERFYNPAQYFFSVALTGYVFAQKDNTYKNNDISLDNYTNKTTYQNYQLSPVFQVGKGRIETVTDAQHAIYILKDLSKNGLLDQDLNEQEIFRLSQEISKIKNKRFLDSRLHLIEEITAVDSFLVQNHFVNQRSVKYMTSLYDNWLYGDAFVRKSGQNILLGLSPYVYYSKNNYSIANDPAVGDSYFSKNSKLGSNLYLQYILEKPFKQKWQHSANAIVSGSLANIHDRYVDDLYGTDSDIETNRKALSMTANYSLGFYPNTRTNFQLGASESFNKIFDRVDGVTALQKNTINQAIIYFTAYYYLSPQLRVSGNVNAANTNYWYSSGDTSNEINSSFSATITYSFF